MSLIDGFKKLGFVGAVEDETEEPEETEDGEFEDEEDDEDEEESVGLFGRIKNLFRREEDREEEAEPPHPATKKPTPTQGATGSAPTQVISGNVILDSRLTSVREAEQHRERVFQVRQIEECRDIIHYLINGESIMLNLDFVDPKDCSRIVDLLSGAAFALSGRMIKIAHLSYLLAPASVIVIEPSAAAPGQKRYR